MSIWTWLTVVVYSAIVYVLVRPGSNAAQAVEDFGDAVSGVIGKAVNG